MASPGVNRRSTRFDRAHALVIKGTVIRRNETAGKRFGVVFEWENKRVDCVFRSL